MSAQVHGTLYERETLMPDRLPKRTGFTPRPVEKLCNKRRPRDMLSVDCNHLLRTSVNGHATGYPLMPHRLWLEAGKHQPPIPDKPDPQYNSNMWRNFRENYGFQTNSEGQKISEMIATMYPLNIPAPSRVGEYTYRKFLLETPLIKDKKIKKIAVDRVTKDLEDFERMRLQSEIRNPPLDTKGNILPPENFTKYDHRLFPPVDTSEMEAEPPPYETRVDIFGKRVPKLSHTPYLWKLSYKVNHPAYEKLNEHLKKKKAMPKEPSESFMDDE